MGRMSTALTVLAGLAGLVQPDAVAAFQLPLATGSRAATAAPAGRLHLGCLSSRPSVGSLRMTVAPEGFQSLGTAKDADVAADGTEELAEAGTGGETKDITSSGVAPITASPTPEVVDESNFTELEKAFAEARRRSLAQRAEVEMQKEKEKQKQAAAAEATPNPKAGAAPAKPVAIAPGKNEGAKLRATAGLGKKKSPPVAKVVAKRTPPKEVEVIKIRSTPKALRDDLEAEKKAPSPSRKKEAPSSAETKKQKAAAAAAPAKSRGGAFSLGAESLEEFFGLTKPRLVSTTKPPSDEPEPTAMPELDRAEVERMIAENGLNEVTLKENFRRMEAAAKAAQASVASAASAAAKKPPMTTPSSSASADADEVPIVSEEELKKIAEAAAKSAVALPANPLVDFLSSAFNFDKFDPEDTPGPPIAGREAEKLRAASRPTTVAEERVKGETPSKTATKDVATKAAAPRPEAAAAPKPAKAVAPKAEEGKPEGGLGGLLSGMFGGPVSDGETKRGAPKAAAPSAQKPKVTTASPKMVAEDKETEDQKGGGLAGVLSGMFGAPVYDDEVDTLPTKTSGGPRAMPVFAPPPAPSKASPPAPKAAAPAPSSKKKDTAAAPSSFLDGLFGGGDKKASTKAEVTPPPTPPAPAPLTKTVRKESPASSSSSIFDGLFGGGDKSKSPAPAPVSKAKAATPKNAPAATTAKAKPTSSLSLFGSMLGGEKKKVDAKPVAPAPARAPAPAPKSPAFSLFGIGGTGGDSKKSSPPEPKAPAAKKSTPAGKAAAAALPEKKAPVASSGGGMLDFLGGGVARKKAPPPAPVPEPEPVKASSSSSSSLFSGLFGGSGVAGTTTKKKPKPKRQPAPAPPPAPTPIVSRVKTMDDSFLRKVSVMLRRNQTKIKKFQQLTDRFRGGLIKASVYYEGVEELFGEDNVEEIIGPLLAALPENDKRKTLQAVYSKAQKAKKGEVEGVGGGGGGGGLGALFGGWGSKSKTDAAAASTPAAPVPTKGKRIAGKTAPAAADPFAFAASKLSDNDYQLLKTRTTLYARGGINARNYYDTLAKVFGDKGVSAQLPALLKALPQSKRKLLQEVVTGLGNKQ